MQGKWPEKKIIPKCECYPSYECDCGSNYGDGFNACHDAFMKVIETQPELVPLENIDKLSHTIKFYSTNYLQVDFSTYGAQKLAEYIALEYGHPKPHSCKCSNNEGARTVRKIDEGLCACPRCGGIIVVKQNVFSVEEIHEVFKDFLNEYNITLHIGNLGTSGAGRKLSEKIHNLLVKGEQ